MSFDGSARGKGEKIEMDHMCYDLSKVTKDKRKAKIPNFVVCEGLSSWCCLLLRDIRVISQTKKLFTLDDTLSMENDRPGTRKNFMRDQKET